MLRSGAKIGRNERCPCGSGAKYKRCCLLRKHVVTDGYSQIDRHSVLTKLEMMRLEDEALDADLREEFFDQVDVRAVSPEHQEMSTWAFQAWSYFDADLGDGWVLADEASDEFTLTRGERRYLEVMKASSTRLYEVIDAAPGATLTLRDLVSGDEVLVQERSASQMVPRWTVLATRVVPRGRDELPVLDGGLVVIPAAQKEPMLRYIRDELEAMRRDEPALPEHERERDFFKRMAPTFHRVWLTPTRPKKVVNYDGDPLLLCEMTFALRDVAAACARLDGAEELTTDAPGERWDWSGQGAQRAEPVIFGFLARRGDELVLSANSEVRAGRGRELVERLLGPLVTYQGVSTTDPLAITAAPGVRPPRREPELDPKTRDALASALEEHLYQHYERWVDEGVPALDDQTPREAAGSASLRPRLVHILKEMEVAYANALQGGDAAFDPSWMWDELGLRGELEQRGDRRLPPPLGHERAEAAVPGLAALARRLAERARAGVRVDMNASLTREELRADPEVQRFLAEVEPDVLGDVAAHLELRANFELHLRKVFWVDEALSWTLGATRLDLDGDALGLPFGAFALVFTDRYALGLGERVLSREDRCPIRGTLLKVVTMYFTAVPGRDGGRGLRIAITFDPLGGVSPHLLVRELQIGPGTKLDAVLDRTFPGGDADDLAPIFTCAPLRDLIRLGINAVLYATSTDVRSEAREPEPEPAAEPRSLGRVASTSETVHFLPGTIDIATLRAIQRARRGSSDFQVIHQAMVRGHWRRAGSDWRDRQLRWIKPYWRGPSTAAVIERQYRLRP